MTLNPSLLSSQSSDWYTPLELFEAISRASGPFDLDPAGSINSSVRAGLVCCSPSEAPRVQKIGLPYVVRDGLGVCWSDHQSVFVNPPYGRYTCPFTGDRRSIADWVDKATNEFCNTTLLLPARTDTRWFQDLLASEYPMIAVAGRIRFSGHKNSAPFPSVVCLIPQGCCSIEARDAARRFLYELRDLGQPLVK